MRTNIKLNQHMTRSPGFKPGPHPGGHSWEEITTCLHILESRWASLSQDLKSENPRVCPQQKLLISHPSFAPLHRLYPWVNSQPPEHSYNTQKLFQEIASLANSFLNGQAALNRPCHRPRKLTRLDPRERLLTPVIDQMICHISLASQPVNKKKWSLTEVISNITVRRSFFSDCCFTCSSTLVPTMTCLSPGTNKELSAYPVISVLIGWCDDLSNNIYSDKSVQLNNNIKKKTVFKSP